MAEALAYEGVSAGYGETIILDDLTLRLEAGESLAVIGRNGVGKTTLLATAMGHTRLHGGAVRLGGVDVSSLAIHRRARAGLGYVPQEREIFPSLSVRQNLHISARPGRWDEARLFALFPNLAERQSNFGDQLSGGEQQMLAIARALMSNPGVLLMDEPTEGLAPLLVAELQRIMRVLRSDDAMAIILVEQNPRVAFDFAERVVVMDRGRIVFDGESAVLRADKDRLDQLIGVRRSGGENREPAPRSGGREGT